MNASVRVGSIVWVKAPEMGTDAVIDGILGELRGHLGGKEPYVLVFDMSHAGVPSALQRRRLAEHMTMNEPSIRRMVKGLGVIVPSPLLRGAVTALFWLTPPPVPYEIFGSRLDANTWAEWILRAREAARSTP